MISSYPLSFRRDVWDHHMLLKFPHPTSFICLGQGNMYTVPCCQLGFTIKVPDMFHSLYSILNPLRVHHQVLTASWLATFIVYQSVRQHFLSARTNFHRFSNINIFASSVFFRTSVSLFLFFLFFSNNINLFYQWKFYFHFRFLYWFSLKFI